MKIFGKQPFIVNDEAQLFCITKHKNNIKPKFCEKSLQKQTKPTKNSTFTEIRKRINKMFSKK
jgi:hypothetical protein